MEEGPLSPNISATRESWYVIEIKGIIIYI